MTALAFILKKASTIPYDPMNPDMGGGLLRSLGLSGYQGASQPAPPPAMAPPPPAQPAPPPAPMSALQRMRMGEAQAHGEGPQNTEGQGTLVGVRNGQPVYENTPPPAQPSGGYQHQWGGTTYGATPPPNNPPPSSSPSYAPNYSGQPYTPPRQPAPQASQLAQRPPAGPSTRINATTPTGSPTDTYGGKPAYTQYHDYAPNPKAVEDYATYHEQYQNYLNGGESEGVGQYAKAQMDEMQRLDPIGVSGWQSQHARNLDHPAVAETRPRYGPPPSSTPQHPYARTVLPPRGQVVRQPVSYHPPPRPSQLLPAAQMHPMAAQGFGARFK